MVTITCSVDQLGGRFGGSAEVASVASAADAVAWIRRDIADRHNRHTGETGPGMYGIVLADGRKYTWCGELGGNLVERCSDEGDIIERVEAESL